MTKKESEHLDKNISIKDFEPEAKRSSLEIKSRINKFKEKTTNI